MAAGKIKVTEAAALLHVSDQFVRIGMQRGILPIGTALKMSTKWTYQISEKLLAEYSGADVAAELNRSDPGYRGGKMEKENILHTTKTKRRKKVYGRNAGTNWKLQQRKFYGYVSADQTVYIIDPKRDRNNELRHCFDLRRRDTARRKKKLNV